MPSAFAPGARYAHTLETHAVNHQDLDADRPSLTWVERNFGYATARAYAYAGHTDNTNTGATPTYVKAGLPEVAAAVAALTGQSHPLVET
ncbi:hypothetical protein ACFVWG_20675 [Kribbella sp. NPDC058245]|uniref:hypothetical protein n=1 Tax=Kribbella sp. NPDC058245 TaxID=3346399 RepID=UPI0036E5BA9B